MSFLAFIFLFFRNYPTGQHTFWLQTACVDKTADIAVKGLLSQAGCYKCQQACQICEQVVIFWRVKLQLTGTCEGVTNL